MDFKRMMTILERFGYIFYSLMLLMIFFFNFLLHEYNIVFSSQVLEIASCALFCVVSGIGLYSFAKTDKKFGLLLIISMITSTLISAKWFVIIISLFFLPIALYFDYKLLTKIVAVILTVPISVLLYFSVLFTGLASVQEEIERGANADNSLDYVVVESDQGALGVDFILYIERDFLNIFQVQKRVLKMDDMNQKIQWYDTNSLRVGDEIYH